ncbi:MAG: hypothetical protein AB7R89_11665 [Dehalococcoidia bacterium]
MVRDETSDDRKPAVPVLAGGLLIDPATGEVLAGSTSGAASDFDQLTRVCREAQQQIKEAEEVLKAARAALLKLLTDEDLPSMRTPYGTASVITKTTRTGKPERVEEIVHRYELAREQIEQIWMCAASLDAKKLDALAEAGALPVEAVQGMVDEKRTSYVQVSAPRG